MRRRLLLGLVPALPGALLFGACGVEPVNLGLSLLSPQGLLDQATSVSLSVFDESLAKCDEKTGHVDRIPDDAKTFPLDSEGCEKGAAWCKTISLDRDSAPKTFAVIASKASTVIAEGCTTVPVDQDPLEIDIQVHRYSPPACCNDGRLEPGEQCDTGVVASCDPNAPAGACTGITEDPVCFCDCKAKEILLSVDDKGAPGLKNGTPGTKNNLALAFGPGGVNNPGMLRAVFEDNDKAIKSTPDIHQGYRRQDLYPITNPLLLSLQLMFPVACNDVTNAIGPVLAQKSPAIATASDDTVVVVFQSNQNNIGQTFDVYLSPQLPEGCTDIKPCAVKSDCQTDCDPMSKRCRASVKLNTVSGAITAPHVAGGPSGMVLVVWARTGGVFGRIWRTDGTTSPAGGEISIAPGGSAPRVAGSANGFRVVYQGAGAGDINGIFMREIDLSGKLGDEIPVNAATEGVQDQPDIAMLEDGSTIVVWHSAGDVFFQRFDRDGKADPREDQEAPLNTVGALDATEQQRPAVAAANGFFTVAWETPDPVDPAIGNIAARFVGGRSGFGYNSVSGQNDEFFATDLATAGDRHRPAVAMSALSGFVAIGWEDHSMTHAGIWVRRFPPPAQ